MLDIPTLTALASSAVTVLTPILKTAAEKGSEELGKASASLLVDGLKQRLNHEGAREALDDLARAPDDTAAQGALNMQFRKALLDDPELGSFLTKWMEGSQRATNTSQTASMAGNENKVAQIVGSGNSVS